MRRWLVAALLPSACGCPSGFVRTEAVLTGAARPAFTGPVTLVLDGASAPGVRGDEVAIVQAVARGTYVDRARLLDRLGQQAAALGCDAIVRVDVVQGTSVLVATGVAVRTAK